MTSPRIVKAVEALEKVKRISESPEVAGIFSVAANHGCVYQGEMYGKDVDEALALLRSAPEVVDVVELVKELTQIAYMHCPTCSESDEPVFRNGFYEDALALITDFLATRSGERVLPEELGKQVKKTTGDYRFEGEIVAVFKKKSGVVRYVVENGDGILHIFSPAQLAKLTPTDKKGE